MRAWAIGLLLLGCASTTEVPEPDSGTMVTEEVPYEGETIGGGPTGFYPGIVDSGVQPHYEGTVTSDPTCCKLSFHIAAGDEPPQATGLLLGEAEPLSGGVPLVHASDAGWRANVCFPIKTSSFYWYEFRWPSSLEAGGVELPDGGVVATLVRSSDEEPHHLSSDGVVRNYLPAVTDCAALDASVGP